MSALARVVWSEGMHLAPHHFQAQTRYFEELSGFLLSGLYFKPYGLVACELSAEALLNGTVSLVHARGVMPDGILFHFPGDTPPEPLAIQDRFSPTRESHLVLLAIPADRSGGAGTQRYVAETRHLPDETTGADEKPVVVGRKNFRLFLDSEVEDGWTTLPLARVRRDGSGHFVYDPEFIPPAMQIGASARLLGLLGRIVELLDAKAETLASERGEVRRSGGEFASQEVVGFWLSHAVHSSLVPLRQAMETRSVHPEHLYTELARLAGALCTFALDSHPRELPAYDHDEPEPAFAALEQHIRRHLQVLLPTNRASIALTRAEPYFYAGQVTDRRCLNRAHWYLGIRSSAGQGETIASVPRLVKVCSAEHIGKLVARGFPALELHHVPAPPAAMSPRLGTQYFRVETSGPCWDLIVGTGAVGVYVPAAIPDAEMELQVVFEDGA